jgi:hypothetical protein
MRLWAARFFAGKAENPFSFVPLPSSPVSKLLNSKGSQPSFDLSFLSAKLDPPEKNISFSYSSNVAICQPFGAKPRGFFTA